MTRCWRVAATASLVIALAMPSWAQAAEIKVFAGRAMYDVLTKLANEFQRTSGHNLALALATPKEMSNRVGNGEAVDVVMSGGPLLETLVQRGKIVPTSKVVVATVGMGVAVRAGAARPDISSVEAFKNALLAAKSIVYSDPTFGGTTGIYFENVLDRLEIAKEIKAKAILNAPTATPNTEVVARGEAELGIQLISEIVSIPGAELLGPFPLELQKSNVLFAGVVTSAPEPEAAKTLLSFLASPIGAEIIRKSGMEPGRYRVLGLTIPVNELCFRMRPCNSIFEP